MSYKIYHNPRCRKSREALVAIQETGVEVQIVEYLKKAPSVEELKDLLMRLNLKPQEIIRKKEAEFKPLKSLSLSDDEWIQILHETPKLIERPIVVKGTKASVVRTPEAIEEILK
jgi:arsenate reductase